MRQYVNIIVNIIIWSIQLFGQYNYINIINDINNNIIINIITVFQSKYLANKLQKQLFTCIF